MKNRDRLYTQWIAHRRQVSVPESFCQGVMAAIDSRSRTKEREWGRFAEHPIFRYPVARWGAGSGLVLLGLFRLIYVAAGLLRSNFLIP